MSFNIIDAVKSQLGDAALGQLGSLIGESQDKTKAATGATVPALLASLSNLASKPEGANQLFSTLGKQDPGLLGNFANLLGSQGNAVAQQGNSLLGTLLGNNQLGSLVGALAKFTGLGQGSTSSLIGTLAPLLLSVLNTHSQSQGLNASGLAGLLSGQKQNILGAMPPGLGSALGGVSGLSGFLGSARDTIGATADTARAGARDAAASAAGAAAEARSGMPRWLLPLIIIAVLAFLISQFFKPKEAETPAQAPVAAQTPAAAETPAQTPVAAETPAQAPAAPAAAAADAAAKFSTGVADVVGNVTQTLTGITDAASANAALPKLKDASSQLDTLKDLWSQVPDSAKPAIKAALSAAVPQLEQLVTKVAAVPGVGDIIQSPAKELLEKLKTFLA
jgi:hypothetical protein